MRRLFATTLAILALTVASFAVTNVTVVATDNDLNSTASLATTTLYTPTADGLFSLEMYGRLHLCGGSSDSDVTVTFSWTDTQAVQDSPLQVIEGNGGTGVALTFNEVIYATSGNPITITINYTPGTSVCPFDLSVAVLKL